MAELAVIRIWTKGHQYQVSPKPSSCFKRLRVPYEFKKEGESHVLTIGLVFDCTHPSNRLAKTRHEKKGFSIRYLYFGAVIAHQLTLLEIILQIFSHVRMTWFAGHESYSKNNIWMAPSNYNDKSSLQPRAPGLGVESYGCQLCYRQSLCSKTIRPRFTSTSRWGHNIEAFRRGGGRDVVNPHSWQEQDLAGT